MPTSRYTVYAHSPSTNQTVRRFDLTDAGNYSESEAHEHAEWFAHLQNTNRYMNTADWVGQVVLEQHGIDTIPGYQG